MDPNIAVGLITIVTTTITTAGVILVAVINNRRERSKAASAGVEAGLDERDVLERMLSLISENDRKEAAIAQLKAEKAILEEDNSRLKRENTYLRLHGPGGQSDDTEPGN